jgi:hypothetical protein
MHPPTPPAVFDLGTDELATESTLEHVIDGVESFESVTD